MARRRPPPRPRTPRRARRIEENFRLNRDASEALGVPAAEAAGHIDALAETMGVTRAEAFAFLSRGGAPPVGTPRAPAPPPAELHAALEAIRGLPAEERAARMAELQATYVIDAPTLMAGLYYTPTVHEGEEPPPLSRALRLQLERINAMPPGPEKDGAFARLAEFSGRSHAGLVRRHRQMIRENRLVNEIHAIRNLAPTERALRMRALSEENRGYTVEELNALYSESIARVDDRISPAIRDRLSVASEEMRSCDPRDITRVSQRIALETGLTPQEVQRWLETERDERFEDEATSFIGSNPATMDVLRRHAGEREMTPEAFMDRLARLPIEEITDPELLRIRQTMDTNHYVIRRSTAEMTAARRAHLIGVGSDPDYISRRNALMHELRGSMTDATILERFRGMTEAERVQFIRDYRAEAAAMEGTEDRLPSLEDVFTNALEFGDEATGVRLLHEAQDLEENWDDRRAFEQLEPVPIDEAMQERFDDMGELFPERRTSAETDESRATRSAALLTNLRNMTELERAEFVRQWTEARQREVTTARDDGRDPPSTNILEFVTADSEVWDLLNSAKRLHEARSTAGVYTRTDEAVRAEHEVVWAREVATRMNMRTTGEALRMMRSMAEGTGASMENTWRLLTDQPVEEDPNGPHHRTPEEVEQNHEESMSRARAAAAALETQFNLDYFSRSDDTIIRQLENLSPAELDMLDGIFAERGQSLRDLLEANVDGSEIPEFRARLRDMENWQNNQTEFTEGRLVDQLAEMDPTANADLNTPEGIATRMAGIRDLPEERRFAALADMQRRLMESGGSPEDVVQAFLAGPGGLEGQRGLPPMLTPAMTARMEAINALPRRQREAELRLLADFMGTDPRTLRRAAAQGERNLEYATELNRIQHLPPSERDAALATLRDRSELTTDQLYAITDMARAQGLVQAPEEPLPPAAARRMEEIRDIRDDAERETALRELMEQTGLSHADLLRHATARRDEARGERDTAMQAANEAQNLADAFAEGRTEDIRQSLERYQNDPAAMRILLQNYPDGADALRAAISSEFGSFWTFAEHTGDEARFLGLVDVAEHMPERPDLPPGVDNQYSLELARIRRLQESDPGLAREQERALRERLGLSGSDWEALEAHAQWNQAVIDLQVTNARRLIETETGSMYVDNEAMAQILQGIPDHVLAALDAQMREEGNEGWADEIIDCVDDASGSDFRARLNTAVELESIDLDHAQEHRDEAVVDHTFDRIVEELDSDWVSSGNITQLLRNCTPEQLRALDQRMQDSGRGSLEDVVEESQQGIDFGPLKWVALVVLGPVAAFAMYAVETATAPDADDLAALARIRGATLDMTSPDAIDQENVARAQETLTSQLEDADSWFGPTSTDLMATLTQLNPAELIELRKQWNEAHPDEPLEDRLKAAMSGDSKSQMVAMFADAEDAVNGRDRGAEMQRDCLRMVRMERLEELKRDPANAGKSEEDLWKIIDSERAQLQRKAQDKAKSIGETAQSIFTAIDGIGDETMDALDAIAGKSPEELELVALEYRRHFGKDMLTHLEEDLGWWDSEEFEIARDLMNPETRTDAMRRYIGEYSYSWGTEDEEKLYSIFENMSVEERTEVVAGPGGAEFMEKVKEDLGENESAVIDALTEVNEETGLVEGNPAHAAAAKIKIAAEGGAWWDLYGAAGTDESAIIDALDDLTPEQVAEAERYFDTHLSGSSGNFRAMMQSELTDDSPEAKIVEAELNGDKVAADVQRIKYSAQEDNPVAQFGAGMLVTWAVAILIPPPLGLILAPFAGAYFAQDALNLIGGADTDLLEKTLKAGKEGRGGRDPEHLAKVRAAFNAMYGSAGSRYEVEPGQGTDALDRMLSEEFGGLEREYFGQLATKGEASDELTLLYAMQGAGTKEDKVTPIMERFAEMNDAERAAFRRRFKELSADLTGVDASLDDWIQSDFSGREGFELQIQLMGPPKTPQDYVDRARMRYDFERGGLIGSTFMDAWESMGGTSAVSNLNRSTANIIAMVGPDGQLRPGHSMEQLEETAAWQEMDYTAHGAVKDAVADAVSTTVQVVGGIVLAIIPGTQGGSAAIWANLALQIAAMAAKMAIKGSSYGWEEGLADVANLAVGVATGGLGDKIGGMGDELGKGLAELLQQSKTLGRFIDPKLFATVGKEFLKGGFESFLNAAVSSEAGWDKGFDDYLLQVGQATVRGALTSAAKGGFGHVLSNNTQWGRRLDFINNQKDPRLVCSFQEQLGLKYLDSVLKAAFSTAIDPDQWEAFASGKGFTKGLFKNLLVDTAIDALKDTATSRMDHIVQHKIWEEANKTKKAIGEAEEQLKEMDDDDPERAELVKKIAELKKTYDAQAEIARTPLQEKSYAEWEVEDAQAQRNARRDASQAEIDALEAKIAKVNGDEEMDEWEKAQLLHRYEGELHDAQARHAEVMKDFDADKAKWADKEAAAKEITDARARRDAAAQASEAGDTVAAQQKADEAGHTPKQTTAPLEEAQDAADEVAQDLQSGKPLTGDGMPPADPGATPVADGADAQAQKHQADLAQAQARASADEQDANAELRAAISEAADNSDALIDAIRTDLDTMPVSVPPTPEATMLAALPPEQARAVTSGDKEEVVQVFENPEHRGAVRDSIMDEDSPDARRRAAEALLDRYEGDAEALKAQFKGDADHALRDQIDAIMAERARPTAPMSDDEMVDHLVEAQRSKKLTPNDVDHILAGADEAERESRLRAREDENERAGRAAMGDTLERYPQALVDAHLEGDPKLRDEKIAEVVQHFDKAGQGAATKALAALDGNPQAQLELAHHLAVYDSIQAQDPRTLTEAELTSLVKAHAALMKSSADEGAATLRKVITDAGAADLLTEKYGSKATVGGCVGDAQNTEGLTGSQTVEVLGLDYDDKTYVRKRPDGTFEPVDQVLMLEMPLTSELKQNAKITVDQSVHDHIAKMAAAGDPDAQALLDRAVVKNVFVDEHGDKKSDNPYAGTGGTVTSDRLPGATRTINEEMELQKRVELPDGTTMKSLGADGVPVTVATYRKTGPDTGEWVVDPNLPADQKAHFQAMVDVATAKKPPPPPPSDSAPLSQHVGTSAEVGETYTAMARGELDVPAVQHASEQALTNLTMPAGMDVRLAHVPQDTPPDPSRLHVQVEVGEPKEGSVASYELQPDGSFKIIVSAGALDHHVERAIAHELAEIQAVHAAGKADNAEFADALAPGATTRELSPHDLGRVAELDVIARQLRDPPEGSDPAQLRAELADLVDHLGLGHVEGSADRRQVLADHLGADHPVLQMLDAEHAIPRKLTDAEQDSSLERATLGERVRADTGRYPQELLDAQLEADPVARTARIADAVEQMSGVTGQGAVRKALEGLAHDPEAQLELAHHLAVYGALQAQDPRTLTEDELTSLVRAHAALMKSSGEEGVSLLRKVISDQSAADFLTEKHARTQVGGCIGDAENTQGLNGSQIVEVLGLDYKDNRTGDTPYLRQRPDGTFEPIDTVMLLEMPLTSDLKASAKITFDQVVIDHMKKLAAAGDADAAALLARSDDKNVNVSDPENGAKDPSDPYKGTGGTVAGDRLPGATRTINQEMDMTGGRVDLPNGTQMKQIGPDGIPVTIATFHSTGPGKGDWIVDPNLPAADKAKYQAMVDAAIAKRPPPPPPPPPGGGGGHIATAAEVGEFNAMARGELDEPAVQRASETALGHMTLPPDLDVRLAHVPQDTPPDPSRLHVQIEVGTPREGSVASYEQQPDGSFKVIVSAGALDHHVERAIAHELAEIRAVHALGREDNAGIDDALAPGARTKDLSPHDLGRIAELDVIARQLSDPPAGVDRAQLTAELGDLLDHLGLVGHAGAAERLDLVRGKLGSDPLVMAVLDAEMGVAPKPPAEEVAAENAEIDKQRRRDESPGDTARRLGLDPDDVGRFGPPTPVTGVELHNHFTGILEPADLVRLVDPKLYDEDPVRATIAALGIIKAAYDADAPDGLAAAVASESAKGLIKSSRSVAAILADPEALSPERAQATLDQIMRAGEDVPFDESYRPRTALIAHLAKDPEKGVEFVKATLQALADNGVRYAELQGSVLETVMPLRGPDEFHKLCQSVDPPIVVRFLPNLSTPGFSFKDGVPLETKELNRRLYGTENPSDEDRAKMREKASIGFDVCGAEKARFTDQGMENFEQVHDFLAGEAAALDKRMVLRPHVGEGYGEDHEDREKGFADSRPTLTDAPAQDSPQQVAHHNIGKLLDKLEEMEEQDKYEPGGPVVVRLGHVTHADDHQMRQMHDLGVIAEVNIGSNLATGSLLRHDDPGSRLDNHPLLKLLYHEVPVVLSTDGQGTMNTDLQREYALAQRIIDEFRSGQTTLQIKDDKGETHTVRFDSLDEKQKAQFDIARLHQTAATYHEQIDQPLATPFDVQGGTARGGATEEIGTSGEVGSYDAMSRGIEDHDAVRAAAADAVGRLPIPAGLDVRLAHQPLTPEEEAQRSGPRVSIEVGTPKDGAVASYEFKDGVWKVVVAPGAADHQVERAIAHELAEIKRLTELKLTDNTTEANALTRKGQALSLSPNDLGRLAEIEVLHRQIANPPPGTSKAALQAELTELILHMGMAEMGPEGARRRGLLVEHFKEGSPVLQTLREATPVVDKSAVDRRDSLFLDLHGGGDDEAIVRKLKGMSPQELLWAEAHWNERLGTAGYMDKGTFRETLDKVMSGRDRAAALDTLDAAHPVQPGKPLPDAEREAAIAEKVSSFHKTLNRLVDGTTSQDVVKELRDLRTPQEAQRFFEMAKDQFGPGFNQQVILQKLAERLSDAEFATAKAHLAGDPITAAALTLADLAGEGFVEKKGKADKAAAGEDDTTSFLHHAARYATKPADAVKADVVRPLLDVPERIVETLAAMHPEDREQLLRSPLFAAIKDDLVAKMPEKGALRHKLDAILDPDPAASRAGLLAARLQETLYGTGRALDKSKVTTRDREGLAEVLDALKGNPVLFQKTMEQLQANLDHDEGLKVGGKGPVSELGMQLLRERILDKAFALTEESASGFLFGKGGDTQEHFRGALGAKFDTAVLDSEFADVAGKLAQVRPGQPFTGDELHGWVKAMERGGEHAAQMMATLQAMGIDPTRLADYTAKRRELEVTEKAHLLLSDLHAGNWEGVKKHLTDEEFAKKREALDKIVDNDALPLHERQAANKQLQQLEDERGVFLAKIKELGGGKSLDELVQKKFGEVDEHGRMSLNKAQQARKLAESGKQDEATELVETALSGAKAKDKAEKIMELLKGKKPEDIAALAKQIRQQFGNQVFLSATEIAGSPVLAATGKMLNGKRQSDNLPGESDEQADKRFIETVVKSALGGREQFEALLALKGDPKAVFDEDNMPEDPAARRKAAQQRLDLTLEILAERLKRERSGGVVQTYLDWEEAAQHKLGLSERTGAQMDATTERVQKEAKDKHAQLVENPDPKAWKEIDKRVEHATEGGEAHVQFREDAAESVGRSIEHVGRVLTGGAGALGADNLKFALELFTAAAKLTAETAVHGGKSDLDMVKGVASFAGQAAGPLADKEVIEFVAGPKAAELFKLATDAQKQVIIGKLTEVLSEKALDPEFWKSPDKLQKITLALGGKIAEDLPVLAAKGELGTLVSMPEDEKDEEKGSALEQFVGTLVEPVKKPLYDEGLETANSAIQEELTGEKSKAGGVDTVNADVAHQAKVIQKAIASRLADQGVDAGTDPSSDESIKAMLDLGVPPVMIVVGFGVAPDKIMAVAQKASDAKALEELKYQLEIKIDLEDLARKSRQAPQAQTQDIESPDTRPPVAPAEAEAEMEVDDADLIEVKEPAKPPPLPVAARKAAPEPEAEPTMSEGALALAALVAGLAAEHKTPAQPTPPTPVAETPAVQPSVKTLGPAETVAPAQVPETPVVQPSVKTLGPAETVPSTPPAEEDVVDTLAELKAKLRPPAEKTIGEDAPDDAPVPGVDPLAELKARLRPPGEKTIGDEGPGPQRVRVAEDLFDTVPANMAPPGHDPDGGDEEALAEEEAVGRQAVVVGTSSATGERYKGNALKDDPEGTQLAIDKLLGRLAKDTSVIPGIGVMARDDGGLQIVAPNGNAAKARIETVPQDQMKPDPKDPTKRAVAQYTQDPVTKEWIIMVSQGADPDHVHRAIAHECVELRRLVRDDRTSIEGEADTLTKDSPIPAKGAPMSAHDEGRCAEMAVIHSELRTLTDPAQIAKRKADLAELVDHMGFTGEKGFERVQWLEDKLGPEHPAVKMARQGAGERPLDNPTRDAQILAAVDSVHAAMSKGFAERVDFQKINAPISGVAPLPGQTLQAGIAGLTQQEVMRFLAVYAQRYGKPGQGGGMSVDDMITEMASRGTKPRDMAEARAHLSGDPKQGAIATILNAVGNKGFLEQAELDRPVVGETAETAADMRSPIEAGASAIKRGLIEDNAHIIEVLANLSVKDREAVLAETIATKKGELITLEKLLDKKLTDEGPIQHKWNALKTAKNDLDLHAQLIAAGIQEALTGTGQKRDLKAAVAKVVAVQGADALTKREDVLSLLDKLRGNPELYEKVVAAYKDQATADKRKTGNATGAELLHSDVTKALKKREWDLGDTFSTILGPIGTAIGHARTKVQELAESDKAVLRKHVVGVAEARLEHARLDASDEHREVAAEVAALRPGKRQTSDELDALVQATRVAERGQPTPEAKKLLEEVEKLGGIERLTKYADAVRAVEAKERAHQIMGAIHSKLDAVPGLLEDKDFAVQKRALQAKIDNPATSEADRGEAQFQLFAAQKRLEARQKALETAMVGVTGVDHNEAPFVMAKVLGEVDRRMGRDLGDDSDHSFGIKHLLTMDGRHFGKWAEEAWRKGVLDDHDALFFATHGAGADPIKAVALFQGKTPEQIDEMVDQYIMRFVPDDKKAEAYKDPRAFLDKLATEQFGGTIGLQARLAAQGDPAAIFDPAKPGDEATRKERAQQRLAVELKQLDIEFDAGRGGSVGRAIQNAAEKGHAATGTKAATGQQLEATRKMIGSPTDENSWVAKNLAKLEAGDEATWKEFKALRQMHTSQTAASDAYRTAFVKDTLKWVKRGVALATLVIGGPLAAPLAKILIGAATGLASVGVERAVRGGGSMGRDDVIKGLAQSVIGSAASAGFGAVGGAITEGTSGIEKALLEKVVVGTPQAAVTGGLNQLADPAVQRQANKEAAVTKGVEEGLKEQAVSAATRLGADEVLGDKNPLKGQAESEAGAQLKPAALDANPLDAQRAKDVGTVDSKLAAQEAGKKPAADSTAVRIKDAMAAVSKAEGQLRAEPSEVEDQDIEVISPPAQQQPTPAQPPPITPEMRDRMAKARAEREASEARDASLRLVEKVSSDLDAAEASRERAQAAAEQARFERHMVEDAPFSEFARWIQAGKPPGRMPVEEGDPEFVGTSAAVGTTYTAMSRGAPDKAAVERATDSALTSLGESRLIPPEIHVQKAGSASPVDPANAGKLQVTVEVGTPKNGAVASYEKQPDGTFKVIVSAGAADHHVARAIAHELAEIKSVHGQGAADNAAFPDALRPGSKVKKLSPHDLGRLAEMEILHRQLQKPPPGVSKAALRKELRELEEHLGLNDKDRSAGRRKRMIAEALGSDHPAVTGKVRKERPIAPNPDVTPDDRNSANYQAHKGKAFIQGTGDEHEVDQEDVNQGGLGDCYLMAGLAATARANPKAIQNAVKDNGDGTYDVTLYKNGKPVTIRVDDQFPSSGSGLKYADFGDKSADGKGELWPALIEKAYAVHAQRKGKPGYAEIEGGLPGDVVEALTGKSPTDYYPADLSKKRTLEVIEQALNNKNPVSCATLADEDVTPELKKDFDKYGFYANHCYTFYGVDHKKGTVKLRNPWGSSHTEVPIEVFRRCFDTLQVNRLR